jgi:hypothetical protein
MLASGILILLVILIMYIEKKMRKVVITEECCGGDYFKKETQGSAAVRTLTMRLLRSRPRNRDSRTTWTESAYSGKHL